MILLAYLIYQSTTPKLSAIATTQSTPSLVTTIMSTMAWSILVALAILLKETGIVISLIVLCQSLLVVLIGWLRRRLGRYTCSRVLWTHCAWVLVSFGSLTFYFVFRHLHLAVIMNTSDTNPPTVSEIYKLLLTHILSISSSTSFYLDTSQLIRKAENPYVFILITPFEKVASYMYLHMRYFALLLFPAELCAEYAYDCIPKISSPDDIRFWIALSGYAVIVGVGVFALSSTIRIYTAATSSATASAIPVETLLLSLAWLIIPFLPASGVCSCKPRSSLTYFRCFYA